MIPTWSAVPAALPVWQSATRSFSSSTPRAASQVWPVKPSALTSTRSSVGVGVGVVCVGVGVADDVVVVGSGSGSPAKKSAQSVPPSTSTRRMIRAISGHVQGLRFFFSGSSSPSASGAAAVSVGSSCVAAAVAPPAVSS